MFRVFLDLKLNPRSLFSPGIQFEQTRIEMHKHLDLDGTLSYISSIDSFARSNSASTSSQCKDMLPRSASSVFHGFVDSIIDP
jgi:hypothetical protein